MPDPTASPTRDELIELSHDAIVPMSAWRDRDSAGAHEQVAFAWALLRAGAAFVLDKDSNDNTWWIEITYDGFNKFELGEQTTRHFYIPTRARLERTAGRDWY